MFINHNSQSDVLINVNIIGLVTVRLLIKIVFTIERFVGPNMIFGKVFGDGFCLHRWLDSG